MRKSGLGLALLFSLIAPIKAVYAEAIMISGKLQADLPAVSFDPGPATLLHTLILTLSLPQVQAQPVM